MSFKEVPSVTNFVEKEKELLRWWYEAGVVKKYLQKNRDSSEKFKFLDGPITANNPMGVHHAHGRTLKDFFQRYKNMRGLRQHFQNGFDSQGLWVEVEVEKDLGFNSKREIEEFGLENFSKACRKRVEKYSKVQTEQSKRLGMFMDWGNDYYTMSDNNNEHIWYFLKKCHEKNLLYKGQDSMPWCARCGTAISQHELSDGGYKDVTHDSVYVRFPLTQEATKKLSRKVAKLEGEKVNFLVWTTTPWTLLSNSALAVHPEYDYSVSKDGDSYLILAKSLAEVVNGALEQIFVFKGQELLDLLHPQGAREPSYVGPFADLDLKSSSLLVAWDEVSEEEGTGVVHIAPGAGREDFLLGQEYGIHLINSIDEFGNYLEGFGEFSGKNVKGINPLVYDWLEKQGLLFKKEPIHHTYPHCWRCKEELVFRTTDEWFIKMDPIRDQLKEEASNAEWIPEFAGKRMLDWLDLMGDWPISRRRYWGLALPIFESEDKTEYYVVGKKDELRRLALEPEKVDELPELHRPWIDEIKIKSPKTQNTLTRISAVGDAWLDAGIVPFSTVSYLTNKDYWKKWYPFDLVAEYVPQVRLWFYSTLVMSVVLEGKAPWKTVFSGGFIVDEKGDAMHKSAGNAIEFSEAADTAGADTMRWLYLREKVANYYGTGNLRFGFNVLDEVRRRFLMILWNSYRFVVNNAILDSFDPTKQTKDVTLNILDKWILSRLNFVINLCTRSLDELDSPRAAEELERFVVGDFSQWYLRRSRDRIGPNAQKSEEKKSFYYTTYTVLMNLTKLLAPFTPFIADEMYRNLRTDNDPESVHLCDWPEYQESFVDFSLEEDMVLVREIVEKGHAARKNAGVRVRQPLKKLSVTVPFPTRLKLLKNLIADDLNVKRVDFAEGQELAVELNTEISSELKREGYAREIVRAVQTLRRKAGYTFSESIDVFYFTESDELKKSINEHKKYMTQKLLANSITKQSETDFEALDPSDTLSIDGHKILLATKLSVASALSVDPQKV